MTAPTDTHRRAAIRGREAVAQSRIRAAVWAGRLYAALFAALTLFPFFQRGQPNWAGVAFLCLLAVAVLGLSELLRRGNRAAAGLLLAAFVVAKLGAWLVGGEPLWQGALWTIVIAGALINGLWGTIEMAAARRDSAAIPPAPASRAT